jgi:chemotaxis protein MotB
MLLREITIAGHTDADPVNVNSRFRNNWILSSIRAQRVMQLLYESSNIPAENFNIEGNGEFRPTASNKSRAGKAENRRIAIKIVAQFEKY